MTTIKKPSPPTLGLAIVADLWLWGALLLYAPTYLGIPSGWEILFYLAGFIALVISFAGALTELAKLWQSEGLSYWGVSLVFLIPGIALFLAVEYQQITGILGGLAKVAVLILVAVGGAMLFQGIPYFFWKQDSTEQQVSETTATDTHESNKKSRLKTNLEIAANIVVALLTLATAIVTLVQKIIP